MANIKKIHKTIKDESRNSKVIFSGLIRRTDIQADVTRINSMIRNYCTVNSLGYIDNTNIDASCLNKEGLHLNRKGIKFLSHNISESLNIWSR